MVGEYFSDEEQLKLWLESEKEPVSFKQFMDIYIYGVNFEGYWISAASNASITCAPKST